MPVFQLTNNWGPDERVYRMQALAVREYGFRRGFRLIAERFVSEHAEAYPSPLRWLWISLLAVTSKFGWRPVTFASLIALPLVSSWVFQSWLAGLLSLTSPLALTLGKRALQDVTVALAVLLALGFSMSGSYLPLAATLFALLALKEAAVLFLPALFSFAMLKSQEPLQVLAAFGGSFVAWLCVTRLVVGPLTWTIFRAILNGHATPYTRDYQSGGVHRLCVDLAIVSPLVLFLVLVNRSNDGIALFVFCALAVVAHGAVAVNNVRTILVVDVALRALTLAAFRGEYWWWMLAATVAFDLLLAYQLRNVYDPTTASLGQTLRFLPSKDSSDANQTGAAQRNSRVHRE